MVKILIKKIPFTNYFTKHSKCKKHLIPILPTIFQRYPLKRGITPQFFVWCKTFKTRHSVKKKKISCKCRCKISKQNISKLLEIITYMVQQVYFEFIPGIQDKFSIFIFLYLTETWLRRLPSFIPAFGKWFIYFSFFFF